jgi:hemolysin activation/secretion protein
MADRYTIHYSMTLLLLAQLVAPPLQQGPLRLPGTRPAQERPALSRPEAAPPLNIEIQPAPDPEPHSAPVPPTTEGAVQLPRVMGISRYNSRTLATILDTCSRITDPEERINACAAALTTRLVADGYVNSRVFVESSAEGAFLDVVEGRLVEVRVTSPDERLNRRVMRMLRPLQGSVLHLPTVERQHSTSPWRAVLRPGRATSPCATTATAAPGSSALWAPCSNQERSPTETHC